MLFSVLRAILRGLEKKPELAHAACVLCIKGRGSGCPLHSLDDSCSYTCDCADCRSVSLERALAALQAYTSDPNYYLTPFLHSFSKEIEAELAPTSPCTICQESADDCMFICDKDREHRVHYDCLQREGEACARECGGKMTDATYSCKWSVLLQDGRWLGSALDDFFMPPYSDPPALNNLLGSYFSGQWRRHISLDYCGRCGVRYVGNWCLVCDVEAGAEDVGELERSLRRQCAQVQLEEKLGAEDSGDLICESRKITHCTNCGTYRTYLNYVPLSRLLSDPRPCDRCGHYNKIISN